MNQIIEIPIYNQEVMVHFGDIEELKTHLTKYLDEVDTYRILQVASECQDGITLHDEPTQKVVVMMPSVPSKAEDYGILVHELSHAVNYIMKQVGIKPSEDSEEAYTYLLGYLTKEVFQKFTITSGQSLLP